MSVCPAGSRKVYRQDSEELSFQARTGSGKPEPERSWTTESPPLRIRTPVSFRLILKLAPFATRRFRRGSAASAGFVGRHEFHYDFRMSTVLTTDLHPFMVCRLQDVLMTAQTAVPPNATVAAGTVRFGNHLPLALIAGPCVLESRTHALDMAGALKEIAGRLGIGLVYKTSFDKANRTSATSARGVGLDGALGVFEEIRARLGVPVLTDVHENGQCAEVATAVDVLQIPAFLCRQTDLLLAAAATGKVVNVKKG